MNTVGLRAVLFFVWPVAGAVGALGVVMAQAGYFIFNWAGDRLRRQ